MRALALVIALAACSSQDHTSQPAPAQTPASTPPSPTEAPAPDRKPPGPTTAAECASDADCATTTYAPEPVKEASSCCAAFVCARVTTRKSADDLTAAWSEKCAAVRCRAPDCPAGAPEPVATCRDTHCVAR